jgi:hypothetical protein
MKKRKPNTTLALNLLMALVMTLIAVLHFTPFWNAEGHSVSLMGYLGFPDKHNALTAWLNSSIAGGFEINQIVFWAFFPAVFSAAGTILCLRFREKTAPALMALLVSVLGILFCILSPAFRLGTVWGLYLALYLLLLSLAAGAFLTAASRNCHSDTP